MAKTPLPEIDIAIEDLGWHNHPDLPELIEKAVKASIEHAKLEFPDDAELSILLTNDDQMKLLNKQWRQKNAATNVLSFPGSDVQPGEPADGLIGDIVVAYRTVSSEAEANNIPFSDHFCHLVIHGFLHLFGYDHQNGRDAECMEALERKALAALGIPDPYLESVPVN